MKAEWQRILDAIKYDWPIDAGDLINEIPDMLAEIKRLEEALSNHIRGAGK